VGDARVEEQDTTLDWLYGEEGTEIIIGGDSRTRVANDGTVLNEMWTPPGELCRPVRWWDSEQVLAACHGDVPSLPHEFYSVLWAIPRSGGVGEPIIEIPKGRSPTSTSATPTPCPGQTRSTSTQVVNVAPVG